jgi:AcrR family transcriptional regulator
MKKEKFSAAAPEPIQQAGATRARGRPRDPARLRKVVETAHRHFAAHGFERASLDAIALDSGVSKVTIYSYFASKQALYEAAIADRTDGVAQAASSARLDPNNPKATLTRVGAEFLKLMRDDGVLGQHRSLFGSAAVHSAAGAAYFEQGPKRLIHELAEYLQAAHDAAHLKVPKPHLAADQFLSLFLGEGHLMALLGIGKPSAADDAQLLRENVKLFLARYGAQPQER